MHLENFYFEEPPICDKCGNTNELCDCQYIDPYWDIYEDDYTPTKERDVNITVNGSSITDIETELEEDFNRFCETCGRSHEVCDCGEEN